MPEIASPNSNTNRDSTQPVDLLDCNKGGLTQLDQWLLAVKIDLAAASRLIRTGRPAATNKPMSEPRFHRDGQFDARS